MALRVLARGTAAKVRLLKMPALQMGGKEIVASRFNSGSAIRPLQELCSNCRPLSPSGLIRSSSTRPCYSDLTPGKMRRSDYDANPNTRDR